MSYESDVKLIAWKRELDERCRLHLKNHPEIKITTYDRGPIKLLEEIKVKVEVNQIDDAGNGWEVVRNGIKMHSFYGLNAHLSASQYANKLLNPDMVLPRNPCIFCGGYSCHREGCIDKPKDGMDFPRT